MFEADTTFKTFQLRVSEPCCSIVVRVFSRGAWVCRCNYIRCNEGQESWIQLLPQTRPSFKTLNHKPKNFYSCMM